jgi:DNA-binding HxlR family transcriptional regulator
VASKRSYGDACGVARALDLVGARWALLVVRELLLGPKRFTDLAAGVPGMSPNVLSQRLRELEESGIVRRRKLGPPAGTVVYELTERGAELEPVLIAIACWGSRAPMTSDAQLSTDALILALRTTFDPVIAATLTARYELRLGDDRFHVHIADGRFDVGRFDVGRFDVGPGPAVQPDAVVASDAGTLRGLVFAGRPLDEAERAGDVSVTGDHHAVAHLLRCFPRPTPA